MLQETSFQELLVDFEDYLRTRKLQIWEIDSHKVEAMRKLGLSYADSDFFIKLAEERDDETIANMVIVLIHQEDVLLRKHIEKQLAKFINEGGFRESLTKARKVNRKQE